MRTGTTEQRGRGRYCSSIRRPGLADSGMAISVRLRPVAVHAAGFTARVAPAWGADAMSGAEALWSRDTFGSMGMNGSPLLGGGGTRLDTEVGLRPAGRQPVRRRVASACAHRSTGATTASGTALMSSMRASLPLPLGIEAERQVGPVYGFPGGFASGAPPTSGSSGRPAPSDRGSRLALTRRTCEHAARVVA